MNKFVKCIDDRHSKYGGPKKGQIYRVYSEDDYWLGIKLTSLDPRMYEKDVIDGIKPNWGKSLFKNIRGDNKVLNVLYGEIK